MLSFSLVITTRSIVQSFPLLLLFLYEVHNTTHATVPPVSLIFCSCLAALQFRGLWENVLVTIERPGPIDPNGPCANTRPSDDQMVINLPDSKSLRII